MEIVQLIYILCCINIAHFISDFVLQSRQMGENKGKSLYWLTYHIGIYTFSTWMILSSINTLASFQLIMDVMIYPLLNFNIPSSDAISNLISKLHFNPTDIVLYSLLNGGLHWVTDFITSKCSGYFYLTAMDGKKIEGELLIRKYVNEDSGIMTTDVPLEKAIAKATIKYTRNMKGFWTMIGLDQAIHTITLIITLLLFI